MFHACSAKKDPHEMRFTERFPSEKMIFTINMTISKYDPDKKKQKAASYSYFNKIFMNMKLFEITLAIRNKK